MRASRDCLCAALDGRHPAMRGRYAAMRGLGWPPQLAELRTLAALCASVPHVTPQRPQSIARRRASASPHPPGEQLMRAGWSKLACSLSGAVSRIRRRRDRPAWPRLVPCLG